jgi:hypothetical protein
MRDIHRERESKEEREGEMENGSEREKRPT